MARYSTKKAVSILLALFALFGIGQESYATVIVDVDQSNPGPRTATAGAFELYVGQSFTPSMPAIDAIEFFMGSTQGTDVLVDLLEGVVGEDGLAGPVMATSVPTYVKTFGEHDIFCFNFAERVAVVPGQTYVAALRRNPGTPTFGFSLTSDTYPGGKLLREGRALDSPLSIYDMIFTEGMVPEPATLLLLGLGACVLRRRN
jgi:hypothetical protein